MELDGNILKALFWGVAGFVAAIAWTPLLTGFLYRKKMWRKEVRQKTPDGYVPEEFQKLHKDREVRVPRLGGLLIWVTTLGLAGLGWLLARVSDVTLIDKLNFVSRSQTWLPLFALGVGSVVGLADDIMQIFRRGAHAGGGMKFLWRVSAVTGIGIVGALWFFFQLERSAVFVPFLGEIELGVFYLIFFVVTMLAVFSGGVVDGLDGLSGGVFATIFAAYGMIAFFQEQYDIAALCLTIVGTTLAFLWFNIPPARFYLSETGTMGLTVTLTIVAFLTEAVAVLPVIGAVLVAESASVILQLLSKKFRDGKKIFRVAPLHHHFEAIGWPATKVTMRFWVISAVSATLGVIIHFAGS